MPDAYYNDGLNGFAAGEIDFDTATIKVGLLRTGTYVATHKFVSEVVAAGATLVSSTAALASKTIGTGSAGAMDAADTLFASVPTGAACNAMILYQASAVTGGADVATTAQRLIAWLDSYTGLPVTPNGANINLAFPNDALRIARI